MELILFDFDGTLTKKDSFIEFIAYYKGRIKLYTGFLVRIIDLSLFFLGLISNTRFKEIMLSHFFREESVSNFNKTGEEFALRIIPGILRDGALETIKKHSAEGNRMIVVTASCSNWIKAWTDKMGLELIATELEEVNGKISGKISGKNCYGSEKVIRIKSYVDLDYFDSIIAYGDSDGDRQMLDLADVKNYRAI